MASAVSFLFHIPDVNIKAMKGEKIMNNAFEQYDKNCQRIIFIKVDHFNKILSDAKAGVTILHRNMELHNNYQAYLDNLSRSDSISSFCSDTFAIKSILMTSFKFCFSG